MLMDIEKNDNQPVIRNEAKLSRIVINKRTENWKMTYPIDKSFLYRNYQQYNLTCLIKNI